MEMKQWIEEEITRLQTTTTQVCRSALDVFPRWISKPRIKKHKIIAQRVRVQGDFHTFSAHLRSHDTM